MQTVKNKDISIQVNPFGAELSSIVANKSGREYLWQGNPEFWQRRSPILFPVVGSLWNGEYRYEGKTYEMTKHGFARDTNFELDEQTSDSVTYVLKSNSETKTIYPFDFEFRAKYKLIDNKIEVSWMVKNTGNKTMYFQVGAHPAFFYADFDAQSDLKGYMKFDKKSGLKYNQIVDNDCIDPKIVQDTPLDSDGLLPIVNHLFDKDVLLFDNKQITKTSLLDKHKNPIVTLHFDAPVVGIWSPKAEGCPFVCIEPWYGRCDRTNFTGEIADRDWIESLESGKTFDRSYCMEIHI